MPFVTSGNCGNFAQSCNIWNPNIFVRIFQNIFVRIFQNIFVQIFQNFFYEKISNYFCSTFFKYFFQKFFKCFCPIFQIILTKSFQTFCTNFPQIFPFIVIIAFNACQCKLTLSCSTSGTGSRHHVTMPISQQCGHC